jgi:flagellar motor switch protein FliG
LDCLNQLTNKTMSAQSQYRKAAMLISALDAETADLLLAEMPIEVAEAVRREVVELSEVDVDEQDSVIDEFLQSSVLSPAIDPPGLELNDDLAVRLASAKLRFEESEPEDSNAPLFQSLHTTDAGVLASAIESEPPHIISVVIANLPAHRAGDVLARLSAATQAEVIRRLAGLQPTSREVLEEVEQFVLGRVRELEPVLRQPSGLATVSTILNSADEASRRQILNNLARHDRSLAGKLRSPIAPAPRFTFDDVCQLDTDGLLRVVQAAPPETAVLAFAGADAELVAELAECLPPDESQRFAAGIAELGPTRLADIEAAQSSLAELASQLAAEGRLHGGPPIHLTAVA